MTLAEFEKRKKQLPDAPGVYFFLGKNKEVLYIGKATSLRSRVRSYFASDLMQTRGPLLVSMLEKAVSIDWRETDSVLEALILEANLIRTHKPKHNTDLKDDKSFNHVVITDEDFPRVLLVRGKELASYGTSKSSGAPKSSVEDLVTPAPSRLRMHPQTSHAYAHVFGPFPHGAQLKEALRIIRKIFPYRDTCTPYADKSAEVSPPRPRGGLSSSRNACKPCFNAHIGLCPGVCSGAISKTDYRKIIRRIVLLFQGKKSVLVTSLERDMKRAAKLEHFEEAASLRGQLFALNHIQDVSLIKDEYRRPSADSHSNTRIEAYDAAHLQGSAAVGVMTVVEDGLASKAEYRKFILRATKPGDDAGALREILSRRLGHDEWPLPRLIVVDGSKAQLNAAASVLAERGIGIPLVGVVKDEKHRPRSIEGDKTIISGRESDILLANAEAHRYAITFHRNRMRKR